MLTRDENIEKNSGDSDLKIKEIMEVSKQRRLRLLKGIINALNDRNCRVTRVTDYSKILITELNENNVKEFEKIRSLT